MGSTTATMAADSMRLLIVTTPTNNVSHLAAYIDGGGSGSGTQSVRPVIYRADTGALLTTGPAVTVNSGDPARWVSFALNTPGLMLSPGDYSTVYAGLHFGGTSNVVRMYSWPNTTAGRSKTSVTFTSGAPATATGLSTVNDVSVFLGLSATGLPPAENVTEIDYARFGFATTQTMLTGGPRSFAAVSASCEWHGTRLDPEKGAFCLVDPDGPLAEMVGDRLLVTNEDSGDQVSVYCMRRVDLDADMSLTRQYFARLGAELSLSTVAVRVEVLA